MKEPEDHSSTRPISVAELLARNGSIGAPPVGGRRRHRRGHTDSVTVAELTGEMPIITDSHPAPEVAEDVAAEEVAPEAADEVAADEPVSTNGAATDDVVAVEPLEELGDDEPVAEQEADAVDVSEPDASELDASELAEASQPAVSEAEADYEAHLEQRDVEIDPVLFAAPPRRAPAAPPSAFSAPEGGAEQMSPDPFADDDADDLGSDVDLIESLEGEAPLAAADDDATQSDYRAPSYLRSGSDTLFGGHSVADDLARRGRQPGPEDIDLGEDERPVADELEAEKPHGSAFLRGLWVVAQCIIAVAFGAGLFIAFDLLWKWNNIIALVLSVLVILGLVVGVRVVRKTEDIGSTLIAVAVGALVTLGPLALLSSH
jgi:hypothetical protein